MLLFDIVRNELLDGVVQPLGLAFIPVSYQLPKLLVGLDLLLEQVNLRVL